MKVIIVGINHAGTNAARTIKKINPNIEVVAYDRNDNISFLGCGIALWVRDEFENPDGLFYANPDLLRKEGIKVNMRHDVIDFNRAKKKITIVNLETNEQFVDTYDKIIFAVGSWPIIPPIPNIDLKGIQIVKIFQHAKLIRKANLDSNVKKVVVCGAGYIGVELVDAFSAANKEVTLIDILPRIMPNYYDEEFTSKIEKGMSEAGVNLHLGETVKSFKGSNGTVTHVVTDKGEYEADLVIWCVGFRPATKLLKDQISLSNIGAVKLTPCMNSVDDKNVFAIGDCTEVQNNARLCWSNIALATTAVRTALIAALNVTETNKACPSTGFQGSNAIEVFDWKLSSTGLSKSACRSFNIETEEVYLEDWDRPEFMQKKYRVYFKLVWDKNTRRIVGAQVASKTNHTEVMYLMSLAIQKELTIDELPHVDLFFLPHFNKPFNFITLAALRALKLNF